MFEASTALKRTEELLENILLEIRILNKSIEELPGKLRAELGLKGKEPEQPVQISDPEIKASDKPAEPDEKPHSKTPTSELDLNSILKGDIQLK